MPVDPIGNCVRPHTISLSIVFAFSLVAASLGTAVAPSWVTTRCCSVDCQLVEPESAKTAVFQHCLPTSVLGNAGSATDDDDDDDAATAWRINFYQKVRQRGLSGFRRTLCDPAVWVQCKMCSHDCKMAFVAEIKDSLHPVAIVALYTLLFLTITIFWHVFGPQPTSELKSGTHPFDNL
jgi:hypothetical protein